jgi:hypothetical protein
MNNFIAVIAVGVLIAGRAGHGDAVRDKETAIRIGVNACVSNWSQPPRKELHAEYRAGKWRVWWGGKEDFVFTVNVDAATGAAGMCTVGAN